MFFGRPKPDECLAALFFGDVHQFIAVLFSVLFGEVKNVFAVVAVLRELRRIFREELLVANGEGEAEFIELIASVIDVKLTPNIVACGIQNGGEAIAEPRRPRALPMCRDPWGWRKRTRP